MINRISRGNLRHKITFRTVTSVSDGMGGFTDTDTDYYTCWASIWPVSAKELVQNQQLEMTTTHRIRIDYKSGITEKMTIEFGSRVFRIVAIVNPEERNIMLDILATEK